MAIWPRRFTNEITRGIAIALSIFSCTSAHASEFGRLCQSAIERKDKLFAECQQNARPFKRDFYPGGRGLPVPEQHYVWFDTTESTPHFGFGCVLGPKDQVRFFGIYYFLKADQFRQANAAMFTFVDFDGNGGLRADDGSRFTLLAVHRLTPPGRKPGALDRNCQIGRLEDPDTSVHKVGDWYQIHRIDPGPPMTLTHCLDQEIRFKAGQCFSHQVRSFVNETRSPIIYGRASIVVSEEGRLFLSSIMVERVCDKQMRPLLEYVQIARDVCEYDRSSK